MFTAYDIEQAIEDKYGRWPDEFWEAAYDRSYRDKSKPFNLPKVGEVYVEDTGEDRNTDSWGYHTGTAWIIIRVGEQYFRKNGFINSYGTPEYDGILHEVRRHEETIVVKSWQKA